MHIKYVYILNWFSELSQLKLLNLRKKIKKPPKKSTCKLFALFKEEPC